jgi:hypothetical protein
MRMSCERFTAVNAAQDVYYFGRQLQREDFHSISDLRVVDSCQLPDRKGNVFERDRIAG